MAVNDVIVELTNLFDGFRGSEISTQSINDKNLFDSCNSIAPVIYFLTHFSSTTNNCTLDPYESNAFYVVASQRASFCFSVW